MEHINENFHEYIRNKRLLNIYCFSLPALRLQYRSVTDIFGCISWNFQLDLNNNENNYIKIRYNSFVFTNNTSENNLLVLISTKFKINVKIQVKFRNNNNNYQNNILSNKSHLQNILNHPQRNTYKKKNISTM